MSTRKGNPQARQSEPSAAKEKAKEDVKQPIDQAPMEEDNKSGLVAVRSRAAALAMLPPIPEAGDDARKTLKSMFPAPLLVDMDVERMRRTTALSLADVKFNDQWAPIGVYNYPKGQKFLSDGTPENEKDIPVKPVVFGFRPNKATSMFTLDVTYSDGTSGVSTLFSTPMMRSFGNTFKEVMGMGKYKRQAEEAAKLNRAFDETKSQFSMSLSNAPVSAPQEITEGPYKGMNCHFVRFAHSYRKMLLWAIREGLMSKDYRKYFRWAHAGVARALIAKMSPMELWVCVRPNINIHSYKGKPEEGEQKKDDDEVGAAAPMTAEEIMAEDPVKFYFYLNAPVFVKQDEHTALQGANRDYCIVPQARVVEAMYNAQYNIEKSFPLFVATPTADNKFDFQAASGFMRQNPLVLDRGAAFRATFGLAFKPSNKNSNDAKTILPLKPKGIYICGRSALDSGGNIAGAKNDDEDAEFERLQQDQERLAATEEARRLESNKRAADELVNGVDFDEELDPEVLKRLRGEETQPNEAPRFKIPTEEELVEDSP